MCHGDHNVPNCPKFNKMNTHERWGAAKGLGLCYRCLGSTHRGNECKRTQKCGIDNCQDTHHPLLHDDGNRKQSGGDDRGRDSKGGRQGPTGAAVPTSGQPAPRVLFTPAVFHARDRDYLMMRTVLIVIRNGNTWVRVNALMDECSSHTYITDAAAESPVGHFQGVLHFGECRR